MLKTDEQWRKELADFLKSRRQRLNPVTLDAEIISNGSTRRRTPGLRREEVASLAGVGLTWYTWLEQGRPIRVSTQVLESLAQTLRLDAKEKEHLFLLAHRQLPITTPAPAETVSPTVQQVLDKLNPHPAFVMGPRMDLIGWNKAYSRVFGDFENRYGLERNVLWMVFTDSHYRSNLLNWAILTRSVVAQFRAVYGQFIGDAQFENLIEQLKIASPEFAEWWQLHDVENRLGGRKDFMHPLVGRLSFDYMTFLLTDNPNLKLSVLSPRPDYDTLTKLHKMMELAPFWLMPQANSASEVRR